MSTTMEYMHYASWYITTIQGLYYHRFIIKYMLFGKWFHNIASDLQAALIPEDMSENPGF